MKKTALIIVATAIITWGVFSTLQGVRRSVESLWLISAIKVPGKMAIADIQTDINEGRYDLAKAKLQAFKDTWQRFDRGPDSFNGLGIGDIMLAFGKIETNQPPKPTGTNLIDESKP